MSTALATSVRPREVVTDDMVRRGLAVLTDSTAQYLPEDLVRSILAAALHDPTRCGSCGGSLAHVKAGAVWCSAACSMAAYRARKAHKALTRTGRRRSGRQLSFRRAVRVLAGFLADRHGYSEARAEKIAERVLHQALPKRQRHPRPRVGATG